MDGSDEWMGETLLESLKVYPIHSTFIPLDHMSSPMLVPDCGAYGTLTSLFPTEAQRFRPNGETTHSAADSGHGCVSTLLKGQSERGDKLP